MNKRVNSPENFSHLSDKSRISDFMIRKKSLGVVPFELEILHCRIGAIIPFRRSD